MNVFVDLAFYLKASILRWPIKNWAASLPSGLLNILSMD